MNLAILHAFIADQRKAKDLVAKQLNLPPDIPAIEWADQYSNILKQFAARPFADVFIPHGFGLELRIGDFYIDFDYSKEGRPDGFDEWRIFVYITAGKYDNRGPDQYLRDRIFDWFVELRQSGKVTQHSDNLYYLIDQENSVL